MTTKRKAIERALRIARRTKESAYVVFSRDENDIPGNDFHAADELDRNTFYAGCDTIFEVLPCGVIR